MRNRGSVVVPFVKMHGAANDFVVVDHRRPFLPDDLTGLVRRLCDRRRGVGADGVLLLETSHTADAAMRYFNADGGPADYCGNGARCLARFALDLGVGAGDVVTLETPVGIQTARRRDGAIEVRVGVLPRPAAPSTVEAAGRPFVGRLARAGVPHFVVPVDRLHDVPVGEWGAPLRHHARFGAEGANVDFVVAEGDRAIAIRTYERGVEGETLACGSGAIAGALAAAEDGQASPIRVRTAGGDVLRVAFEREDAGYEVTLAGPAEVAFRGEWREAAE